MKPLYLSLLCVVLLASCSPRVITKGVKDKTSSYVVTQGGEQINIKSLNIKDKTVIGDSASYPLTSLSAVKYGESYFGVKEGNMYDGVYYGKVILLRRLWGSSYDFNTNRSRPVYAYYLQKENQAEIVNFNNKNLQEYVKDNPLALRKAKAARIYSTISYVSIGTTLAGLGCVFLSHSSPIRKPAVTIGLFSLPVFLITMPIAPRKEYRAVKVYNR